MPLFGCRWPNGDLALVLARNKEDAVEQLDEFGNADHAEVFTLRTFLAEVRLKSNGKLSLRRMGEEAQDILEEKAFPVFAELFDDPEWLDAEHGSPEDVRITAKYVRRERNRRVRARRRQQAKTQLGQAIQSRMRMAASLANRIAEEVGEDILTEYDGPVQ